MNENDDYLLVPLGEVTISPRARDLTSEDERNGFLRRHQIGDWKQTDPETRAENTMAMLFDGLIRTVHEAAWVTLWITTSEERRYTYVGLAGEVAKNREA